MQACCETDAPIHALEEHGLACCEQRGRAAVHYERARCTECAPVRARAARLRCRACSRSGAARWRPPARRAAAAAAPRPALPRARAARLHAARAHLSDTCLLHAFLSFGNMSLPSPTFQPASWIHLKAYSSSAMLSACSHCLLWQAARQDEGRYLNSVTTSSCVRTQVAVA